MSTLIKDNSVVLFQGDSVTDCGRDRELGSSMGYGYVNMATAVFSACCVQKRVKFINKGISGNRVKDLQIRWEQDCIELKPDVLSILIGINDCWRKYDSNDPTSIEMYEGGYRDILNRTKKKIPDIRIVLCEPFVLPVKEGQELCRDDLDPKIHVVRKLAREYGATFVPLDGIFAQACALESPAFWAADGFHPTPVGHALIAKAWLEAVCGLKINI